uniref:Ubiquitin-like protein 7 n=2 Tax=Cacopsylla melanoneura TaxID=428564 RepID=A0A8D8VGC0_9HEMI
MPFIYAGLSLIPGKFDKIKLHNVNYEETTGEKLKQLILSELEKRSEQSLESKRKRGDTESKEKKFKGDVPRERSEIDAKLYAPSKFSPEEIDLVYCGKTVSNNSPIQLYNIEDYVMVHVFYKQRFVLGKSKDKVPAAVEEGKHLDTAYINSLLAQFQRVTCSPSFGKPVLRKLRKPENLKKLLTLSPALKNDPVALSIIKEPDLLLQINNVETVTKIAQNHPALARCVSDIVDILFEEMYNALTPQRPSSSPAGEEMASSSAHNSVSSPYASGDEDMDLSPSVGGESGGSGGGVRITAEQVAAALQRASTSGSSSTPQSPAITPEYVNSTMMQIMSNLSTPGTATASSSSAPSTSVTSPTANVSPGVNLIEQYASQIQQMRDMGLSDELVMVQALQLTNGDVSAAVNLVFSGTLSGEPSI